MDFRILALITVFGLFVCAQGIANEVLPTEQTTQFGENIVAHGTGDGAWFRLLDEFLMKTDGGMMECEVVSKRVVSAYEYPYALMEEGLKMATCVPGGVLIMELECGKR